MRQKRPRATRTQTTSPSIARTSAQPKAESAAYDLVPREERIRRAAYFMAEREHFYRDPMEYWLTAEAAIDAESDSNIGAEESVSAEMPTAQGSRDRLLPNGRQPDR
jgi:hypothetical protein